MQHYHAIMYIQNDVVLISIEVLKACLRILCIAGPLDGYDYDTRRFRLIRSGGGNANKV